MQSRHVLALHGFLGEGADWNQIQEVTPEFNWIKPNLFSPSSRVSAADLKSFEAIADKIVTYIPASETPIFVGYSLGGRIGLHLLERHADRFQKFIFISTHAGLTDGKEKAARKNNDVLWNQKLLSGVWSDFWSAWCAQPVFASDRHLQRHKEDFDQQKLSYGLTTLSLAEQKNKEDVLQKHSDKVLWLVGDQDQKFLDLAEDLKRKKILSGYERIFNSGHRVLFDQPSKVAEIIRSV